MGVLLLATAGCAPTAQERRPEVSYDYDVQADFSRLHRYSWLPAPATSKLDPLNAKRIVLAVDRNLQSKGLQIADQAPDFTIAMQTNTFRKMDTTSFGHEYGIYDEGKLNLVFFDAGTNAVLWQGETRARISPNLSPAEKDRLINAAVEAILRYFPPPPKN
jgi:hypothetical protein